MPKIFFDHQKFSTQKYGGISRYFANIINAISDLPELEYLLGVLYSNNHYLSNKSLLPKKIQQLLSNPKYAYKFNTIYCNYLLNQNNFDIFHPTYYDTYFLDKLRKPLVITIHDMTYEKLPEYFWAEDPLTLNKRLNIDRADQIIAISETTKKDLIAYSNVDTSKIQVIYHGIDLLEPLLTKEVTNLPESYLLFVGDRSGYKNFYLFLNAFKELSVKYPNLKVILTGGGRVGVSDLEYIHRLKLQKKVAHINVTDEELNYLYQNALAFVYPSLHEGFGLPILEAFKASCPVILSDTDCFREIGANAVAYFHPHQKDSLIDVLENVIINSELRKDLIDKGLFRLKDFPIDKSIRETIDVYKLLS